MGIKLCEKELKVKVNKKGSSFNDPRLRFKFVKRLMRNHQSVILIRNTYTKAEKILRLNDILRNSPFDFKNNLHPMIMAENVNCWGKEFDKKERYVFSKFKKINGESRILVKSCLSGIEKWASYNDLRRGMNPFRLSSKLQDSVIAEIVNKMGSKSKRADERYEFVKTYTVQEEGKHKSRKVVIRNLLTKEIKHSFYQTIKNGLNPFGKTKDRHETMVVHPLVRRGLKRMGLVINQEVKISSRSRVDFTCTTSKGKIFIVEVKSDKKKWTEKHLTEQTKRYSHDGRAKYKKNFAGVFLVSINGIHGGYALKDLPLVLKQKGLV